MAEVKLAKQLLVSTENKVGMLAEVCVQVSGAGVNIQGINAYTAENKAYFRICTDDNQKAQQALQNQGYSISEQEIVTLELPNRVGALKEAADKLKAADIDLEYIYGTTGAPGNDCLLIINSNNNTRAVELLKG